MAKNQQKKRGETRGSVNVLYCGVRGNEMADIVFERLRKENLEEFRDFCRANWPGEHPLIHNPEMFEYYYRDPDGGINFVVARKRGIGGIQSVLGFIKTNQTERPDVWTSYILTKKGSELGLGFKLLELVHKLTNARTIASNNIRKKTRGLYEFLGWYVGGQTQFYRLNENIDKYTICNIANKFILPVNKSNFEIFKVENGEELSRFEFSEFTENKPYKDRYYFKKRYCDNPWLKYDIYAMRDCAGTRALLVVREFRQTESVALRVVDYVGERAGIARCGEFLDRLIKQRGADFCDWFAFGVDEGVMAMAGFLPRTPDDPNIIPLYLSPPVMENIDMTFFTSDPDGYAMFRADGDQDRPNLG